MSETNNGRKISGISTVREREGAILISEWEEGIPPTLTKKAIFDPASVQVSKMPLLEGARLAEENMANEEAKRYQNSGINEPQIIMNANAPMEQPKKGLNVFIIIAVIAVVGYFFFFKNKK
jgi:hypothetical protein